MNIFKKLFGSRKFPIDKLLDLTNVSNFYFWNGVNYNGEIMLTKDPDKPQHGNEYFQPGDWPTFFKIGFGRVYSGYGDWAGGDYTSEPLVEMFINKKDYSIRHIRVSTGFYNGNRPPKELMKKVNKILKHTPVGSIFKTRNEDINQIFDFFTNSPELTETFRYCGSVSHNGAYPGSIDAFRRNVRFNVVYYKKNHPKYMLEIDSNWIDEHPEASGQNGLIFDNYEKIIAFINELSSGPMKIPDSKMYIHAKTDW